MENNFTCDDCAGICCLNPPLLKSMEEGLRAKHLGAKIIAVKKENGYMIAIKKKDDSCPFLDKNTGKCTIYEDRFEACKAYKCNLLDFDRRIAIAVIANAETTITDLLNSGKLFTEPPPLLSKEDIKKLNAKVIKDRNKLLQAIAATNIGTLNRLLAIIVNKFIQRKEEDGI